MGRAERKAARAAVPRSLVLLASVLALGAARCSFLIDTGGLAGGASDGGTDSVDAADAAGRTDAADSGVLAKSEVVVAGQAGVFGLASHGTTLYWTVSTGGGSVRACPMLGCVTPRVVASGGSPTVMASLDRVFWIDPSTAKVFFTTDDDGGTGQVPLSFPGGWVTTSEADAFVVESNGVPVRLQNHPPSGDTSFLGFDLAAARWVARAGTHAWTSISAGTVGFCGAGGCDAAGSTVATGQSPLAIAMDESFLFWSTTDGHVRSMTHDATHVTSSVIELATNIAEPVALATDDAGSFLYVASRGTAAAGYVDGMIAKVAKSGGPLTVLALDEARPEAIMLTPTHVYWTDTGDGTIRRVAR